MNDADISICLDPLSVRLDDQQKGPAGRHRGCDLRAHLQRSALTGLRRFRGQCGELLPLAAYRVHQRRTGATDPDQQGENAAILDRESPLNILTEVPEPTAQFD
jgi:hypothetical protein